MELISSQLDLDQTKDYQRAQSAIMSVLKDNDDQYQVPENDDMNDDEDHEKRNTWLEKKHS